MWAVLAAICGALPLFKTQEQRELEEKLEAQRLERAREVNSANWARMYTDPDPDINSLAARHAALRKTDTRRVATAAGVTRSYGSEPEPQTHTQNNDLLMYLALNTAMQPHYTPAPVTPDISTGGGTFDGGGSSGDWSSSSSSSSSSDTSSSCSSYDSSSSSSDSSSSSCSGSDF
jgi:hypothetical protein